MKFQVAELDTPNQLEEQDLAIVGEEQATVSTTTQALLEIGSLQAGRFRVKSLLGQGGMGKVYRVEQVFLKKDFALKTLNSTVSPVAWRRFQKEAEALALLDHPSLIKVQDFGILDDVQPFFVMDLVEGETLSSLLKTGLSVEKTLRIFQQICEGLGYAHAQGVVHRDIKPGNILVFDSIVSIASDTSQISIKIVDFGIAKVLTLDNPESLALTRTGEIFGTPYYMSPEQCAGTGIDARSDIYSVGCVLFEALVGVPPFLGDTALSTVIKHGSEKPGTLKEASLGKEFPPGCEEVVAKLLEKDANARYQNMYDVAKDLQRISVGAPVQLGSAALVLAKGEAAKGLPWLWLIASTCLCLITFVIGRGAAPQLKPLRPTQTVTPKAVSTLEPITSLSEVALDPDEEKPPHSPQPYFSVDPPPGAKWRLFHFPADNSLGVMQSLSGPDHPSEIHALIGNSFKRKDGTALQGEVLVDPFRPIKIVANERLTRNIFYLKQFRSDEIAAVELPHKRSRLMNSPAANDGTIQAICQFKSVRRLLITSKDVSDVSLDALDSLPNLDTLILQDWCKVTAGRLKKLKRLKELSGLGVHLEHDINQVLSSMAGSTNLKRLLLSYCNLDSQSMRYLSTMPNLEEIDIAFNPVISDDDLKLLLPLKHLTHLNIRGCRDISPAAINYLQKLPLAELGVGSNQFPDSVISSWKETMPQCDINNEESPPVHP